MKLSIKGLAMAGGLTWAIGVFVGGLVAFSAPDWGIQYMQLLGAIFPGVEELTMSALLVATTYALVEGAAGCAVFAWIYNRFAGAAPDQAAGRITR